MRHFIHAGKFALLAVTLNGMAAWAQFNNSGTTTIAVSVSAEAAIRIDTSSTSLANSGQMFADYTGTTNFTYKIRTSQSGGTGAVTLKITSDFSPSGGPSVATPPSAGDLLKYTCSVTAPATACSSEQTASTANSTAVANFGADQHSDTSGTSGNSVNWTLTNDAQYKTGSYSATATFTISAA